MEPIQTTIKTLLTIPTQIKTKSQANQLHAQIIKTFPTLTTNLLTIYSKLNLLQHTITLFNTLHNPSLHNWKPIIKCYTSNGYFLNSLKCFVNMCRIGIYPDHNVFPSVIKCCTQLMWVKFGECVHGYVIRVGLDFDVFVGNALMSMYFKLQRVNARQVFDESPERTTVDQTKNILHYNNINNYKMDPEVSYSCRNASDLDRKSNQDRRNVRIQVFDESPERTTVDRNQSILNYVNNKKFKSYNEVSYNCRNASAMERMSNQDRRNVRMQVFDEKPERTTVDRNQSILNYDNNEKFKLYAEVSYNCQNASALIRISNQDRRNVCLQSVKKVFETMPERDVVSYNTLILGYAQNDMYDEAMRMIREMGDGKLKPDAFTLSNLLPIVAEYMDAWKGKEIHGYGIRHGFERNGFVASGLIDVYAKCKMVEDSYRLFCSLPEKDCVLWCSMIAACVQNGLFDEGLRLFRRMLIANIKPVPISFSSIIPACAYLTILPLGQQLHGYIIRHQFDDNVFISSSLVNMYAKCGNIKLAKCIFDGMKQHDLVSWTAMIMGCASHGYAHDAILLFKQMEMEDIRPNSVAFVAVLTACSHAGMVNEGLTFFNRMVKHYGITPEFEHYACMADLLGRAGKLEDDFEVICSMPENKTASVWLPLLAACRVHKNVELAEKVVMQICEFDGDNVGAYVLLSNIYSSVGEYKDAANVRHMLSKQMNKKEPACSWIRIGEKVHAFIAGDESHLNYDGIINALDILFGHIEKEGYVADN